MIFFFFFGIFGFLFIFLDVLSLQRPVQQTMATFMQRYLVDLTRSDLLYVSLDLIVLNSIFIFFFCYSC